MEKKEYFELVDSGYETLDARALEERLKKLAERSAAEYGESSAFHASMLSELGSFYKGQARFEESERYFKTVAALLAPPAGESSPDYATAINNLAGTHRLMKRFDDAEREFRLCLALYEKTVGKQHLLYAAGLNNLSLLCMEKGEMAAAAAYLYQSADILSALPECRDEYATALTNLGSFYNGCGETERAKKNLLEAISLYETELGTATPHYHAAMNSLGISFYREGNFKNACEWFEKAAEAAKKLYSAEHPEYKSIAEHLRITRERLEAQNEGT